MYVGIKSDSRAALGAAVRLASTSSAMRDLAAEVALDTAEGTVALAFAAHLPAAANEDADALSRLTVPGGGYSIPPHLVAVPRVQPKEFAWRVDE